ncbi:MAG: ribose-phosphate pyrophosphokinase [Planctomycetota bacterium]|jgi:ribose-phosphate pyrophosphokinase|nr:ribose-phosphate pyrophosphokinase [Planctomycetota bacterium]
MRTGSLRVFSGNANRDLALAICEQLDVELGNALVTHFPDGEINIKVEDDVRGADTFIVQPTCPPVNENLMELLMLIDCLRRASAERITAVIPYYGYARKDRKDEGRVPITAKVVADLLTTVGADRILTMDLHSPQIQGFFNIPVDHLYASAVLVDWFDRMEIPDLVVLGPDVGSIKMARAYAQRLGGELAIVDKRRLGPDKAEACTLIGDVEGKNVLVVDDMISTGGSITEAARIVVEHGAENVFICATHALFCGSAVQRIEDAPVQEVVVTDTIPATGKQIHRVRVLTVSELLAKAMKRIHLHQSVSSLFLRT